MEGLGELEVQEMERTVALGCRRVSEEYSGEHKAPVTSVVQDHVPEGDFNVEEVQERFLDGTENVQKAPESVQAKIIYTSVNVDMLQNKASDRIADVDRGQVVAMNGKVQDEALKSSLDVDKDKVLMVQMTVDRTSVQDQDDVLEARVGNNRVRVPNQVPEGKVDADSVQEGLLEGDLNTENVKDDVLVGNVNMSKVQYEGSVDTDPVQEKLIEGDVNLKYQDRVFEETGDESKKDLNKALEKVAENAVDVNEVVNAHGRMDTMRCQVKITTRHSLQLHMANHTARDVYVRLLKHGDRISGNGLLALKDSVHLSPLKTSLTPGDTVLEEREDEETEEDESSISDTSLKEMNKQKPQTDEQDGSLTISDTAYSPCVSAMPTPMEELRRGVDFLFQSPGHLLKELHDDPEMQAELRAERERELAQEAARQSLCSQSNSRPQIRAFLNSAARLVAVALVLLLLLLVLLLVLLESNLEVSFLQDIRQTPEFEQFHYEYYCPLRRWLCYKLVFLREHLWGD